LDIFLTGEAGVKRSSIEDVKTHDIPVQTSARGTERARETGAEKERERLRVVGKEDGSTGDERLRHQMPSLHFHA
jgi:hypothetical protein